MPKNKLDYGNEELSSKTKPALQTIGELRDADKVREAIKLKYGFDVTTVYCLDLIEFTHAMLAQLEQARAGIQVDSLDDSAGLTGE